MFAFLRGTVAIKSMDSIALDVGGAGYLVHVPEPVYRRLAVHQEVTLLTYCHIREDAFQIYGFLRDEDRALFLQLLAISGVGPKVALSVLSAMPAGEFGRAVLDSDVKAFERVPGVGKKLAQRIVLEVKTRLGQDAELKAILGEQDTGAAPGSDDACEALLSLGCTPPEAKKAVAAARAQLGEGASDEDVVRAALRSLAKVRP